MGEIFYKIKPYLVLAVLIIAWIYFGYNFFSYFTPYPWCKIQIHANIAGNRGTIKDAIALLKRTDEASYSLLCRNVDVIYEKYCIDKDWHLNPTTYDRTDQPGCYIKGSRSVYLTPSKDTTNAEIQLRAETLKKLAGYSEQYWSTK